MNLGDLLSRSDTSLADFVGFSGWLIVVWGIRLLFTGKLITGREAEEKEKRYTEKVQECHDQRKTIAAFSEAIETSNAMIEAIIAEALDEPPSRLRPPRRAPPA